MNGYNAFYKSIKSKKLQDAKLLLIYLQVLTYPYFYNETLEEEKWRYVVEGLFNA